MIRKLRDAGRITVPAKNGSRLLTANQAEAVNVQDAQGRFDPEAWTAVLEEQRLCIAAAAGVDPSKVRFHIGH
ncbi:hypothetical protein KRR38_16950 [Novosphingobium sp. G106]|uniref:hypothetical protein n=1 Tax=Novosphingobium sp. G106 TaxID=2849500 RepID=UPI001C2D823E|nr:hypothetical protein [Novosphingobium sp. G106]MBV1689315.1 hypothetical protein [Novosphingobium sp. G106]